MAREVKCPNCSAPIQLSELLAGQPGESGAHCGECGVRFLYDYSGVDPATTRDAVRHGARLRIPGYRLLGVLPAGGMGYLYSAEREASHQLCAVKVLPPDHASHPSLVERFRREIRAMRALRHPCILPIMDAGHEPVHYFTMPFIAGQTLRAAERPTTALGLAECAAVFAPLAEALDEVHQCGFIHRDVKPANIFLTSRGTVLLFDFGIARELSGESTLTEPGVNLGTPAYNAPELYERSETTPRSDQFSLAVVLYEMLTGSLPMGVFRAPRDVCYDLPSASSEAIMRALSHDARDRFDSVRQFAREFFRPLVNRTPIEDFRETIVHLSTQHPSLFDIPPDMAAINASRGRASAFGALIARLVTPGGSRG